jgi:hypothetical protein
MCRRWDGSEWKTLENGKKPFAIGFGNGTWVGKDRAKLEYTSHFGQGEDITHVDRAKGWTFDEWVQRDRYEVRFTSHDHLPWPISTIAQTTGDRFHVSKGTMIAGHVNETTGITGLLGVDSPDANHPDHEAFAEFKKKAKKLGKKENCMAEGLTLGRSTSFITAVMCEMLRAYTVRSTDAAISVVNRNPWMHFACGFSFTMTVLLTIIPGIKEIFYLDTPEWFYYFIAFIFAFGCALNDEFFKSLYRRVLARRVDGEWRRIEESATKQRVDTVVEMLHEIKNKADLSYEHTLENHNAIGRVKQEMMEMGQPVGAL